MSESEATRFIDATMTDEKLSAKLVLMKEDPQALLKEIHSLGYDATPDEIRNAYLESMSVRLPETDLQDIAAGISDSAKKGLIGYSVAAGVIAIGCAAASAAAF